ncbi:AhpA/YtjB family protein [Thalassotalea sp. G2M2-11]|uniref:AhpA/YtjB family protein n=1 Tax=Thalassotalea sp. G2M2-11 TaxID=2787627 RepID=UPI0019D1A4F3|nr:AhpA/YtjB family protein [Thalassotalea sp. G2M2-11]
MTQTELPLYPKVSSIYNKIMQLAIAIFIIIVLMNLWFFSFGQNNQAIEQHFRYVSQQNLAQIAAAVPLLRKDSDKLEQYFDDIMQQQWVKDISLYDATGQLLLATDNQISINDLYGFSEFKPDRSGQFTPFITELRHDNQLTGYIRLTVSNERLKGPLLEASEAHFDLLRLMMILAGVVGFLLTRGLNRFSRQGFRLARALD